ncbi:MAG: nucleotidyltransferase domain-containing protein [Candidatus Lokiarchaeota archaeon]|nr:nucleotidyltransferase domain-containing protein [Candidatus Lokiarchaeota archaeon]
MRPHHQIAIEKFTQFIKEDPKFIALIIGGSIAKGLELEDSDIDGIIIATDEEYKKRKRRNRFLFYDPSYCNYPGGYVEGKVVNLEFLEVVAERGTEPARDAFRGAWIAYSEIPELENLLKQIPIFQKDEKEEKIRKFYAQLEVANWYVKEAERRNDPYLLNHAISDLVLFGGRMILEHNEMLYPFHKWFLNALEEAPDKPKDLMVLIKKVLLERNSTNAQALYDEIKSFRKWEIRGIANVGFLLDTELAWLEGKPYIGDL